MTSAIGRPALGASLKAAAGTLLSMAHTRLSLAGIEIEEEIHRLAIVLALALVALVLFAVGLISATLGVLAAVAPEYRAWAAFGLAIVYLAVALALAWMASQRLGARGPLLAGTLAELEKDRDAFRSASFTSELPEQPMSDDREAMS